jgi:hypoxanthine-guanine phosphoribosyltransferase
MKALTRSSDKVRVFKESLIENASYKLVALFISLILWLSILGRRDFVVTKDVEVDFMTASTYSVAGQSTDKIKIKVSGSQPLLKKFKEKNQSIVFDLSDKKNGMFEVEMTPSKIEIPQGIKIMGIRPTSIRVEIVENSNK